MASLNQAGAIAKYSAAQRLVEKRRDLCKKLREMYGAGETRKRLYTHAIQMKQRGVYNAS
jgi:hypothetical protein